MMLPTGILKLNSLSCSKRSILTSMTLWMKGFGVARKTETGKVCEDSYTVHQSHRDFMIFVMVQPFSTTLFGVPFPLPTPQGR
jgi:hypothetical protein